MTIEHETFDTPRYLIIRDGLMSTIEGIYKRRPDAELVCLRYGVLDRSASYKVVEVPIGETAWDVLMRNPPTQM